MVDGMTKRNKIEKERIHYNIFLGAAILDRWLRYHYVNHHVTEIDIKTDRTDTIMTIALKGEEFPDISNSKELPMKNKNDNSKELPIEIIVDEQEGSKK